MPIIIPGSLPARKTLLKENIFVMDEERAGKQDIRPLKILVLNLMPTKIETETQLCRLLGNTPLQVQLTLMQTESYQPKTVSSEHLVSFYTTFSQIRHERFDGFIITGAPVEMMDFEDVDYWDELCKIIAWSENNVYSSLFICWGAQAALYNLYGIDKIPLQNKLSGIYPHYCVEKSHPLLRGFDDVFHVPHSRHTGVDEDGILNNVNLKILARSDISGVHIIGNVDNKKYFILGHSEYDRLTLNSEYIRDCTKGMEIQMPCCYYPDNNPDNPPVMNWRSHGNLLFSNWINHIIYPGTPYDLNNL